MERRKSRINEIPSLFSGPRPLIGQVGANVAEFLSQSELFRFRLVSLEFRAEFVRHVRMLNLERFTIPASLFYYSFRSLVKLEFWQCNVTDALLSAISKSSNLNTLELCGSEGFTNEGLLVLNNFPKLNNLNISRCNSVTDTVLLALNCPKLTYLNLSRCESITDEGLLALNNHPELSSLNISRCEGD